jgi:hypothetical protein
MKGGEAYNVIPESVTFGGTLRSMTNEGLSYLMKRITEVNSSHYLNYIVSVFYYYVLFINASMEDRRRTVGGTSLHCLCGLHGGHNEAISGCDQ